MRRAISIAVLAALCLAFAGTWAEAQKKPSPAEMEKAKEHYTRAQAYLDLKDYKKAVEEFLAAHALFPDPEFYFNVAEAYRLDGDRERALEYYKKYLEEAPRGRVARLAAASAGEIEVAISEERAKAEAEARAKAEAEARAKAEADRRKAAADRSGSDQSTEPSGTAESPEPEDDVAVSKRRQPRPGRALRIAGLGTAGVGLLAIALGVKFGLDASSLSDEVSDIGTSSDDRWTDENLDKIDRGESAESKMFLFTGLGAAAVIAGGVLYFMGSRKDAQAADSASFALTPTFTSNAAGFALTGNF